MIESIKPIAVWASATLELIGTIIILSLGIYAIIFGAIQLIHLDKRHLVFDQVRQRLGQGILLGLEFLVAADIIHTVAVDLTFETVGVLTIIVLIRTFLSFTLEIELSGCLPWNNNA
ncbi:MAG: DUF1622 domain-containing protein [Anaerolineales bacterium]